MTPTNPNTTAVNLCHPTFSPSRGPESSTVNKIVENKSASTSANGRIMTLVTIKIAVMVWKKDRSVWLRQLVMRSEERPPLRHTIGTRNRSANKLRKIMICPAEYSALIHLVVLLESTRSPMATSIQRMPGSDEGEYSFKLGLLIVESRGVRCKGRSRSRWLRRQ